MWLSTTTQSIGRTSAGNIMKKTLGGAPCSEKTPCFTFVSGQKGLQLLWIANSQWAAGLGVDRLPL